MNISQVFDVPIKDIDLQGVNVRTDLSSEYSIESLNELAESINLNGLMQPIVLRGTFGKGPYDVVVGQRRFKAHQILNRETIQATFTGEINDINALLLSLSENMCRQELNFSDTAEAVTKLYNHFDKDERKVQAAIGLNIRTIRSFIKVEEQATPKIKQLLKSGQLNIADAKRAIDAAQGDDEKADLLIDGITKLTKFEKQRAVKYAIDNPTATAENIIADAKKPKFEETIILNIPPTIYNALKKASEQLSLDIEVLTINALTGWLQSNDYLLDA